MKKIIIAIAIFTISLLTIFVIQSCKKSDNTNEIETLSIQKSLNTDKNIILECSKENSKKIFLGDKYEDFFEYIEIKNSVEENFGNLIFDYSSLPDMTIIGKTANSLKFTDGVEHFALYDINTTKNCIKYKITSDDNTIVNFSITDVNGDFSNFLDNFYIGQNISFNNQSKLAPLVYGLICMVAAVATATCDYLISKGIEQCNNQGKCHIIRSGCRVECVPCRPKN